MPSNSTCPRFSAASGSRFSGIPSMAPQPAPGLLPPGEESLAVRQLIQQARSRRRSRLRPAPASRVDREVFVDKRRRLAAGVPHAEAAVSGGQDRLARHVMGLPRPLRIGAKHRIPRVFVPLLTVDADGESQRCRAPAGGPVAAVPHEVRAAAPHHRGIEETAAFPVLIQLQRGLRGHLPTAPVLALCAANDPRILRHVGVPHLVGAARLEDRRRVRVLELSRRRVRPAQAVVAGGFVQGVQAGGVVKGGRAEPHPQLAVFTKHGPVGTAQQAGREDRSPLFPELQDRLGTVFHEILAVVARGQTESEHAIGD